jgi:hypothetical protein
MLGGWFGCQALKEFLGAIDFTAPGASGWTKIAYKLSLTLVCPQDLISGHLDRFYQALSQFGRMLWFYLVMNQGRYFAIAEGTLTLLAPCVTFSGLWAQKHILSRKDHTPRDKLPYLDVTWLGGSASGSYFQ